jgi:hypothetical protein
MPNVHELKIWPTAFQAVIEDRKTHGVCQVLDRTFEVGDALHLREFNDGEFDDGYTGREAWAHVTDVTRAGTEGLGATTCVVSIRRHAAS